MEAPMEERRDLVIENGIAKSLTMRASSKSQIKEEKLETRIPLISRPRDTGVHIFQQRDRRDFPNRFVIDVALIVEYHAIRKFSARVDDGFKIMHPVLSMF
jgi:hypothetical protein